MCVAARAKPSWPLPHVIGCGGGERSVLGARFERTTNSAANGAMVGTASLSQGIGTAQPNFGLQLTRPATSECRLGARGDREAVIDCRRLTGRARARWELSAGLAAETVVR